MKISRYGVAASVFSVLITCAIVLFMEARQVKAASSRMSPTGFMIGQPITKPIRLPLLTRDQLVTKGRADDKEEIDALFQAYMFYHDTHNGEGVASLFTKDGALEHLWNNAGKTVEPNAGPNGRGCYVSGHDEIVGMFKNRAVPLPFSGHAHNLVTNVIIQVYGDTATLYGNFTSIRSDDVPAGAIVASAPNTAIISHNGEDVGDLKRTAQGWRFVHLRVLEDEHMKFGTPTCEKNVVQHE